MKCRGQAALVLAWPARLGCVLPGVPEGLFPAVPVIHPRLQLAERGVGVIRGLVPGHGMLVEVTEVVHYIAAAYMAVFADESAWEMIVEEEVCLGQHPALGRILKVHHG